MNKKHFFLCCGVILVFHIVVLLAYGMQKQGFHEDEYYSYWSSAGDADLTPENGYQWRSGYDIQSQFFVREDNRFAFAEVIQNQAEDVHPPLYYLALNVLMSCMAGRFYKWFGIFLNLLFSVVTLLGILLLFSRIDTGKNRYWFALLAGAVYAFAPSTVSNVMITRMYAMSAMWTVIYACILTGLFRSGGCSRRKFAAITLSGAAVCYLSFLTHYFCLLEAFFLTLFYAVYVLALKRREILRLFVYGASMLAAIGLAVLSFPACLQHIFRGYRGEGAIDGLLHAGIFDYTKIFLPYINKNVFAGMLLPAAVLTAAALICLIVMKIRRGSERKADMCVGWYVILLAATVMSLYVLTRTALMVGDSSCRYFFPVIALLLPAMAYIIVKAASLLVSGQKAKVRWGASCAAAVLVFVPILGGHLQQNILFLYPEEAEKIEFSMNYQEYPLIMIFDREKDYRSWYTADQLWPFREIFYSDYDHLMLDFEDETLMAAEKVVIYMDCPEDVIVKILEKNTHLSSYSLVRHDAFFYVYVLE